MIGRTRSARLRRRGVRRSLALAALIGAFGLAACGAAAPEGEPNAEVIALGARVYQANCASCHGASGEGQPNWQSRRADRTLPAPPHDASGHTWHHPDDVLIEIIRRGGEAVYGGPGLRSGMPAFGERLGAAEIEAVLAYLKTLWGDAEREYQQGLAEQ